MSYIQEIQAKLGSDTAFRSKQPNSSNNQSQQFSDYISNEISKFRKEVHQFNEESLRDVSQPTKLNFPTLGVGAMSSYSDAPLPQQQ